MKIFIGIDPGPTHTAYVEWNGSKILQHGIEENEIFLNLMRHGQGVGCVIAIEMIAAYGMPVGKEVFETCVFIGKVTEACGDLRVQYVYRKDVKLHICGSPRAKDGNIRQALIDKVGPQGTIKNPGPTYGIKKDEWAALAVAIYAQEEYARRTFGRGNG